MYQYQEKSANLQDPAGTHQATSYVVFNRITVHILGGKSLVFPEVFLCELP